MELIIGGAFQGKTAFAKENFGISDEEIFVCNKDSAPEFDKKCITHIERFSFWCVEHGFEPVDYFFEHTKILKIKSSFPTIFPAELFLSTKLKEPGVKQTEGFL